MRGELKNQITGRLKELGFSRTGILSPLPPLLNSEIVPPLGHCDAPYPRGAQSAVLVFFPYYRNDPREESLSGEPSRARAARLAPFARRNNYKDTVTRLKKISTWLRQEQGLSKDQLRIFCNSRFPEKQMAWHCGMGYLGKNSLLITPEYGSLGVLGGMFLPFSLPGDHPIETAPYEHCRSCRLCSAACPGQALKEEGGINKTICYQHLSTSHQLLPEKVMNSWGNILYGCQICQDVCPYNRAKPNGVMSELGVLGSGLDPVILLSQTDQEMKTYLKGTVPGASWIKPAVLRRNALLSLPREEAFRELVEKYSRSPDPVLAGTADYLLVKYFVGRTAGFPLE